MQSCVVYLIMVNFIRLRYKCYNNIYIENERVLIIIMIQNLNCVVVV